MRNDRPGATDKRLLQPEIPRSHFAQGMAQSEGYQGGELRLGRFSDGEQALPDSAERFHRGRFSQGQELTGDTDPQKHVRRRFSEGLEHPTSERGQ
jgi:hypothetical protein